jgi:hypothetical protein
MTGMMDSELGTQPILEFNDALAGSASIAMLWRLQFHKRRRALRLS